MARTGYAFAELFRHSFVVFLTEINRYILRHQSSGERVVPILASIPNPLLYAARKVLVMPTLRLRQTLLGSLEFPRMLDDLSLRGRQQVLDEFTFRFNRRRSGNRGKLFFRPVQQALATEPVPYESITRRTDLPQRVPHHYR